MKTIALPEITHVIRSKNCSPFEITLDILFKDTRHYYALKAHSFFSEERIAQLYQLPLSAVQSVIYFDPSLAVKINYIRAIPSGAPGDTDVYGAQQHAPLLTLMIPENLFT